MEIAGKTIIREEVFAQLALGAMEKLEVMPAAAAEGTLLGKAKALLSRMGPRIVVKKDEENRTVILELGIAVPYGTFIPEVASRIRRQVTEEIRQVTCWEVERIDVLVERLLFPATPGKEEWSEWPPVM